MGGLAGRLRKTTCTGTFRIRRRPPRVEGASGAAAQGHVRGRLGGGGVSVELHGKGSMNAKGKILFVLCCSLPLAGCVDLTQKLSIDRGGGGHYEIAIAANGLLGEALRDNKSGLRLARNPMKTRIS